MKKIIILFIISIFLFGCAGDAKETNVDGDFVIELLFEKDGCKMYRFRDNGRYIYWSNCQGASTYALKTKNHTIMVESSTSE